MKKVFSTLFILFTALTINIAVWYPEKPEPPRLVNDLAQILTSDEVQTLEQKLVDFANRTTTQFVVVTVPSLNGEDKSMVATEILYRWGVGQKDKDNGAVILIKPKTNDSKGEVFIASGYGLEGVMPDAITKRIVEKEMIPKFKQNDLYGGINKAVDVMMELSLGEYSAKDYEKKSKNNTAPGGIFFLIILIFFIINILGGVRSVGKRSLGKNLPLWILLSMLGSGSRTHSNGRSWGNFSSGSGSFGGGFGGFGGGSGGGGGAGGSW